MNRNIRMMSRRKWLRLLTLSPILPWSLSSSAAEIAKTAKAAEGPYYPKPDMRTVDIDNDLVKIEQRVKQAGGEIVYLTGMVTDTSGTTLSGLRVEIWQCDVNGRYIHTRDSNRAERDIDFQGFGHTYTDQSGQFEFKTIKPVSYPGRTPHIHVKVFGEKTELTTQLYIKNHPENENDSLFNRMTHEQQAAVEMEFAEQDDKKIAWVDVVC